MADQTSEMLELLKQMLPPFVHVELVPKDSAGYKALPKHTAFFVPKHDDPMPAHPRVFRKHLGNMIGEMFGESSKEFSEIGNIGTDSQADGRLQLGIPLLKEAASGIIDNMDEDYVDGVKVIYVVHPPALKKKLIQITSKLPLAPGIAPKERRLIGVQSGGEGYAFPLELYELEIPARHATDPNWAFVHPYNPKAPAIVMRVPEPGPWIGVEPTLALGDTKDLERAAIETVERDLKRNESISVDFTPEPNGPESTFPDFEADIGGTEWTIEVTRVLDGIAEGRVFRMRGEDDESTLVQLARTAPIDDNAVDNALRSALEDKAESAARRRAGTKYCVILVDVADLDIGRSADFWKGKDLSTFDALLVIHSDTKPIPEVEYIKGAA